MTSVETIPARIVRSARVLGISQVEHDALRWVRDRMASGSIVHDPFETYEHNRGFNMNFAFSSNDDDRDDCGSTGCIGGWIHHYMRMNRLEPAYFADGKLNTKFTASKYVTTFRSPPLHDLFYPLNAVNGFGHPNIMHEHVDVDFSSIPTEWAIEAIDNFMATGWPDWLDVTGQA